MDRELEKLDYELESLISVYNDIDAAISYLDRIQFCSVCDTSDVLSALRKHRIAVHVRIIETRKKLVRFFRTYNVVESVKGKENE